MSMRDCRIPRPREIKVTLAALAVQMPGLPKRRRKSDLDLDVVDWPTVAVATAVVVLLIAACFWRWVSH
jgi:hypothetical protein